MNGHLPVLMAMFPDKAFLDVDDIAKCMRVSTAHVYRLSSKNELKVRKAPGSDRLLVSIVEMANYLDSELSDFGTASKKEEPKKEEPPPVHTLITKPKKGRPRGKSALQIAFQSQLAVAIMRVEIETVLTDLEHYVEELTFSDDQRKCAEKFDEAKAKVGSEIKGKKSSLMHSYIQLTVPPSEGEDRKIDTLKA